MFFSKQSKINKKRLSVDTIMNGAKVITAFDPSHHVSEQFRTLRTNIEFSAVAKGEIKTLLISSAMPSEGKSTVSANLAIVYAQQHKKVLLVDGDLRRPTVSSTVGLTSNSVGLTNYLGDKEKATSDVIHHTSIDHLDVITSGPIPPNPSELLGSDRMTDLVDDLKSQYDLIIFDVPPFLMVTDAQVLSNKVDGVVLVVNGGKTKKADLKRTSEILKISDACILGFIYNDQSTKNMNKHGYGYYGYRKN